MGNHFTRNTRNVLDASKQRLDNMEQNDMVSDSEDIYIHNHFALFPITKSLLNVTSDDSITVRQTGKNIRNVRVNEEWLNEKLPTYQKQIKNDLGYSKFITDGNVFMYQQSLNKEQVDGVGFENVVIEFNEINNVRDKHENGGMVYTATAYLTGSSDTYKIQLLIELDDNGLSLTIPYTDFTDIKSNMDLLDSLIIDYTGILDLQSDDGNGDGPIM